MSIEKFQLPEELTGFQFPNTVEIPGSERKQTDKVVLHQKYARGVGVYYAGSIPLPMFDTISTNGRRPGAK